LQRAAVGKLLDLRSAQGGDQAPALFRCQVLANAGRSDHAAVAHQNQLFQAETGAKFRDLRGDGFRIAGVAVEDLDGDRTALAVGEQAEDDLRISRPLVAGVTEVSEAAVAAVSSNPPPP